MDREGALHAGDGRPTDEFAAFCGRLGLGWLFCEAADPQAKDCVERLQEFIATSFEPGRSFADERDFQLQFDDWFARRANPRLHRGLRARPVGRLREELQVMRTLPARAPAVERRFVTRVSADPHVRFDTNDYSLDPRLVGRRVGARLPDRARRGGARHGRAGLPPPAQLRPPPHGLRARARPRALTELRGVPPKPAVELRPLARYDRLIAGRARGAVSPSSAPPPKARAAW